MDALLQRLPFDPAAGHGLSYELLVGHHRNDHAGAVKRLSATRAERRRHFVRRQAAHAAGESWGATQDDASGALLPDVRRAGVFDKADAMIPGARCPRADEPAGCMP